MKLTQQNFLNTQFRASGTKYCPLYFKTERVAESAYARRDVDQLRLNLPQLGVDIPELGDIFQSPGH